MLIPVLIGVTFMVYFILSLSPGDTAAIVAGEGADAATIEAVRKDLGLDKPVIVLSDKTRCIFHHHVCIPQYGKAGILVDPCGRRDRAPNRYRQRYETVQRS